MPMIFVRKTDQQLQLERAEEMMRRPREPLVSLPYRKLIEPKRRVFLMGLTGLAGTFLLPDKSRACQVVTGGPTGFPGQSTNPVGYTAYSGYTGTLTTGPGSFANNGTYSLFEFDGGTSAVALGSTTGRTFNGCYFGSSSGSGSQSVVTGSGPITFNFCTFGPSPSVVGGTFPPQPPSGGGYSTWPTGTTPIAAASGYQYGPISNGSSVPSGGMTFNSCDIWACGNGCVFSHTNGSNPVTYNNCWYHDARSGSTGDHEDGFGDVQSATTGDFVQFLTINSCTAASVGNTQALAMQTAGNTLVDNLTITNNFWAGFGSTLQLGAIYTSATVTNYVFTGNVIGATPAAASSVWQGSSNALFGTSGSGNKWRTNTFAGGTYTSIGTVAAGRFLWPNGSNNATDWTGAF